MSLPRRHRPHHRKPTVVLEYQLESCEVWLPDPSEPITITDFGDAAALAFGIMDLPVDHEVLVLLDEHRAITAMLIDPPPPVGVGIGWCDGPGLEVPFSQTISIVVVPELHEEPPCADDVHGYQSLRRLHMLQGLLLLDVILVDGERVQSIAIASDPDCAWFDVIDPAA
jgi:hypothetical protein